MTLRSDVQPRRSFDASARAARLRALQSARHRRRRHPSGAHRLALSLLTAAMVLMLCGWGGVQVAFENWRRGFSPLQNPGYFDGSDD